MPANGNSHRKRYIQYNKNTVIWKQVFFDAGKTESGPHVRSNAGNRSAYTMSQILQYIRIEKGDTDFLL